MIIMQWLLNIAYCIFAAGTLSVHASSGWNGSSPQDNILTATLPQALQKYDTVLQPPKLEAEWWAGAPSVVQDQDGTFWMACRMRSPEYPRGLRGYEIQLLKSENGVEFDLVNSIHKDSVPIDGFERPALLIDPQTGKFKLYVCGPWKGGAWSIEKFDDTDDLAQIDLESLHPVIEPKTLSYSRDVPPKEYKDPFIFYADGQYHAYVIGVLRRIERVFHFTSQNGETWVPVPNYYEPMMSLTGWHDFYVRPACVLPVGVGYLFFYEGSNTHWYDPVYNIVTGVGHTFDLHNITDLTPNRPLAISSTPSEHFATFRYSHWLQVQDEIWVYAEVVTPDEYHEIRRFRFKKPVNPVKQ